MQKDLTKAQKLFIVARLRPLLEAYENRYAEWINQPDIIPNKRKRDDYERGFVKRIQALKIVIYMLEHRPFDNLEEPSFIVKRNKKSPATGG